MPDTTLTSAELDELERLAKAATPGPWNNSTTSVDDFGREHEASLSFEWSPNGVGEDGLNENYENDAAFIASATLSPAVKETK